ncbi:MAG: hypothetical protein U9N84_13305 [Actinomycetota bacterium]|nr:hypothetical protein [Actinomycetota bacterium]
MRRYLSIGAAWLGATVISVVIASAAVAGIRDRVVDAPVAIGLPTTTTTLAADPGPTTSSPVTKSIVEASSTTAEVATTTEATLPPESTTTSTTTTTTAAPPTTTEPPVATTTTTAPPTTTTTPVSYATYDLIGGTVILAAGDGEVNLVSATPRSGFRVDLEHTGPEEVEIKFESNDHTSKLDAKWEDGELRVKIKEEDSDDDDSSDD